MKKVLLTLVIFFVATNFLKAQQLKASTYQPQQINLFDDYKKGKKLRTTAKIMRWTSGTLLLVGLTTLMTSAGAGETGKADRIAETGVALTTIGVATWVVSIPINKKGKRLLKEAQ